MNLHGPSMVAKKYETEHHEILVRPDSMNLVEKLVRHFDEPFADSSAIPTFIVSEFAARHVKVALTGDGGDELIRRLRELLRGGKASPLGPHLRKAVEADLVASAGSPALFGVREKLSSHDQPADRSGAVFRNNYAPYFLRQRLLQSEWMLPADEAFLRRAFADCLPARRRRHRSRRRCISKPQRSSPATCW